MAAFPPIASDYDITPTPPSCSPNRSKVERWRKKKYQEKSLPTNVSQSAIVPELVREDVYLMDNKRRRIQPNLLANSLTAKLKKSIPMDVDVQQNSKLRRDSLKDILHLENLNKQYTSEMNWQSSKLDKESFRLIQRQNQLRKQSESQRRSQDRMEAGMRSRSGLSSASLPRLAESEASMVGSPRSDMQKEEYPEFAAVDKDDVSHVKVFKMHGVFRPQNKYSSRIDLQIPPKVKRSPNSNDLKESLRMADTTTPVDLPSKSRMSRKGLRVSWSSHSHYYSDAGTESPVTSQADTRSSRCDTRSEYSHQNREEGVKTPSTVRSFNTIRSDTYLVRKNVGKVKSKLDTIGLQWKVNQKNKSEESRNNRDSTKSVAGRLHHNLNPVTHAMDKGGRSTNKTRWQVQKFQSLSTMEMYQAWLEKLEVLKGNPEMIATHLNMIPNRANLSVMTQPVL